MNVLLNLLRMLFRAAGGLCSRRRSPFRKVSGAGFTVHFSDPLPASEPQPPEWLQAAAHAQPDPAWIGRTVARCVASRCSAAALVRGGAGNLYIVSVVPGFDITHPCRPRAAVSSPPPVERFP